MIARKWHSILLFMNTAFGCGSFEPIKINGKLMHISSTEVGIVHRGRIYARTASM